MMTRYKLASPSKCRCSTLPARASAWLREPTLAFCAIQATFAAQATFACLHAFSCAKLRTCLTLPVHCQQSQSNANEVTSEMKKSGR